jgi:signal transduction histidine kinase
MEGGKLTLKIDLIDITKELTEVLEVFRERSERDGIDLITEISGGSIKINGDKNRLKQAFVNIIDNSFKYTKRGGYVKVHLECTDKIVKIVISDNGCGISKNDLPKIREKFYKANNSARGSGIGLAVTDEIIKLHNGEMLIDSTVGQGTETTIILSRKGNIRRK